MEKTFRAIFPDTLEMESSNTGRYTSLQFTTSPRVPSCVRDFTWFSAIRHYQYCVLKPMTCTFAECIRSKTHFGNFHVSIFLQISAPHCWWEKPKLQQRMIWGTQSSYQPILSFKWCCNPARDLIAHDCNTVLISTNTYQRSTKQYWQSQDEDSWVFALHRVCATTTACR